MNVGMKKTDLSQEFFTSSIKRSLLIATLLFSGLFAAINTTAQGISAADISALKGGAMLQGGSSGLGGANLQGMLSIAVPTTGIQDDEATSQEGRKIQQPSLPLPPNEFQNYVIQTTGQLLPLYGSNFFENLRNNNSQLTRSPVSDDYVIGPGDQLLIRVWGSTSAEANVTVDRQGAIAFPKLGTLRLAGVRAGQLDAIVKSYFNKFYKDIEVNVALGKLRKITVFVVGQARNPGSYSLTSQSTLTSAMFASGGPNSTGSIRNLKLMRQGKAISEFDLYDFLGKGDKSQDVKLQDGDVLFYPKAVGYFAIHGKVNVPAIFELKGREDTLNYFLSMAGGLSISADPLKGTLDRIQPGLEQPRTVDSIQLVGPYLNTNIKNGDVLNVMARLPALSNAITLRGAVTQPARMPWKQGMRISDVVSSKSLLISPENTRFNNELLFDKLEIERAARSRARIPMDLAVERVLLEKQKKEADNLKAIQDGLQVGVFNKPPEPGTLGVDPAKATYQEQTEREFAIAQLGKPELIDQKLIDTVGKLSDQTNLDYAVVERFSRETLQTNLLPFNLGEAIKKPKSSHDLILEAGDVITVFSSKDLQLPVSRINAFVRIEGEVNNPGVYTISKEDTIKTLIQKAGGPTSEAYLFATALLRSDVKKSQEKNLDKILKRLEVESAGSLAQISQSAGASSDASAIQAKIQSAKIAQAQSLERFKNLKPEGRISLGLPPSEKVSLDNFPQIRLENGDRILIPPKPDFIQVFGSVNTESALLYKSGLTVKDYLQQAGVSGSADINGAILVRSDGSALSNQSFWGNDVLSSKVLPGDTIVLPEKFDRESGWSQTIRSAKDFTQVLYQLGLGAAAIKTLRQ
jgi:protein involved in polysaccharide export with SLBB domain